MENQLVSQFKNELKRAVPGEYAPLIVRARGESEEEFLGQKRKVNPVFFEINDPVAGFTVKMLEANPHYKKPFVERVRGRDFIDLGCGWSEFPDVFQYSTGFDSMAHFVREIGAKRYIGVDLIASESSSKSENDFDTFYICDEILDFLSKMSDGDESQNGRILFLSGLESMFNQQEFEMALKGELSSGRNEYVINREEENAQYHQALYDEMTRITKVGDSIYIGSRGKSLEPRELIKRGFISPDKEINLETWFNGSMGNQGFYIKGDKK